MKRSQKYFLSLIGLLIFIVFCVGIYLSISHNSQIKIELVELGDYVHVPFQVERSGPHRIQVVSYVGSSSGPSYYATVTDAKILQADGVPIFITQNHLHSYDNIELISGNKYIFSGKILDYSMGSGGGDKLGKGQVYEAYLQIQEPSSNFLKFLESYF